MTILSDEQLKNQEEWEKIILDLDQRLDFAKKSALLRWKNGERFMQCSQRLLIGRKGHEIEDRSNDLWITYKVIQWNLINGGVRYYTVNDLGNGRSHYQNHTTRPIESGKRINSINVGLLRIAAKIADIAKISG